MLHETYFLVSVFFNLFRVATLPGKPGKRQGIGKLTRKVREKLFNFKIDQKNQRKDWVFHKIDYMQSPIE